MEVKMLYRKMNGSGDGLSILGFGCMRLPQKKGTPGDGPIDEKRAESQIKLAIEKGINYFDTAMPYHMGACEPFLGKILSGDYRSRIKLATKLPPWSVNASEDMNLIFRSQLKRLRTDHIDFYLIHALNGETWEKMKALKVCEFLTSIKNDGLIGNAGFSFHGSRKSFETIVDDFDWDFCQIQYNYLDVQNQAGRKGLKYAASKGLGVVVMEPLRGGLLARKPPSEIDAIWDEAKDKKTPVEWALRWIWNHPEVTVVLSGMNEESQIHDNIQYAEDAEPYSLSTEDLELIKRVSVQFYKLMKVGCTGCHYCMPCPSGVNIPTCFEYYNHMHMYKDINWAKLSYLARVGGLFSDPSKASQCEKCGECEEKCPQKLPIQDLLETVSSEMEGPFFNAKVWAFKKFIRFKNWRAIRFISR
jgi:predicted aldo/keto reductase-like oxidoreductase